jgi:multidrug efflux pump subunit AcrA (membrane-fusion protein)
VVPGSAVLETVYGPFVYVANGRALLRTAVRLGARRGGDVEITDGLYGGDQVAVRPVETLYLIELRATKGGGHSH